MSKGLEIVAAHFRKRLMTFDDFKIERKLGKGGYGEVWEATHRDTGVVCALKKIIINDDDDDGFEMFVHEIEILGAFDNPFILKLFGFSIQEPYIIATPYISGGSLYDYVSSSSDRKALSPTENTIIAIGISYGMMKLHEMKIVHRDLKSANILLDENKLPIICDFGISRAIASTMTKDIGTTNWMAPEQMASGSYDEKVDVYAFGCILFEMIARSMPFEELTSLKVAAEVMKGNRPKAPHRHKRIRMIIKLCWEQDPAKRPSMRSIFRSFVKLKAYFNKTHYKAIERMIQLIGECDQDILPDLQKWTSEAQRPEDGSIIFEKD
jgi:serine/threonine protein kinase